MHVARVPAGRHVLAELRGVAPGALDDADGLRLALTAALTAAGATVLQVVAERFPPQGVTLVALLAESHASGHTWPEHGVAHVDVFTCGAAADPGRAVALLGETLGATEIRSQSVPRGGERTVLDEPLSEGVTRRWELGAVRHAERTPYQRVLVADTAHGVTLFCDDERQSAEHSQLAYHEALMVPALTLAARVDAVLVVGSSEGVACELAVAAGATRVDHVDIDLACVRACAHHLPYGYTPAALDAALRHDGPVRLHVRDGVEFVASAGDRGHRYDVVVVDLPDERPDEPGAQLNRLYGAPFLAACAGLLREGGVVCSQAGSPALWRNGTLRRAWARFHEVFAQVVPYVCDEHEWVFLCGRMSPGDAATEMAARLGRFAVPPTTVDAAALRTRSVAPHAIRS